MMRRKELRQSNKIMTEKNMWAEVIKQNVVNEVHRFEPLLWKEEAVPHGELGTLPKEAFKPSVKGLPQELKDVVGTVASPSWYTSNPAGSNLVYANVNLMMHAHAHDTEAREADHCMPMPRLERLALEPKLATESARRCSDPVLLAISRTTWLRWSTLITPSCMAQSMASSATPSERTRERESMTAWLWWEMVMDMGFLGAKMGSSSNGSPSTCSGSRASPCDVIVTDEHWQSRLALVRDIWARPSCSTPAGPCSAWPAASGPS